MKPQIIAHRGARDEAFENTKVAFDKALAYPIDGIETDLRMTEDKKIIIYHDQTLFKLNATRKRISGYTYEQLCCMSSEISLLTLSEMLKLYASRTRLMLEIKTDKADHKTGRHLELTGIVLKELKHPKIMPHLDNIFVLSFDAEALKAAHQNSPHLKYVLNLSDSEPTAIMRQPESETDYLYAVCVNRKYLSEKLVSYAHNTKKQVMTYACNTAKQARKAMSLNADVLMTDKPGFLTQWRQRC